MRTVQQALDTITGTLAHIKRNKAGAVAIRSDDVNYAGNVVIYQADNDVFGETKYPLTLTLTPNPNDSTLGTWINETAAFHGGEWTEGDWYALVHALLRRMVNLKLYGTTDEPDTPEDYGLSPRGEDYGKPEEDQP